MNDLRVTNLLTILFSGKIFSAYTCLKLADMANGEGKPSDVEHITVACSALKKVRAAVESGGMHIRAKESVDALDALLKLI